MISKILIFRVSNTHDSVPMSVISVVTTHRSVPEVDCTHGAWKKPRIVQESDQKTNLVNLISMAVASRKQRCKSIDRLHPPLPMTGKSSGPIRRGKNCVCRLARPSSPAPFLTSFNSFLQSRLETARLLDCPCCISTGVQAPSGILSPGRVRKYPSRIAAIRTTTIRCCFFLPKTSVDCRSGWLSTRNISTQQRRQQCRRVHWMFVFLHDGRRRGRCSYSLSNRS